MSNNFYQELESIYRQCTEICDQYAQVAIITISVKVPDGEEEILSVEDDEELEVDPTDECPTHHILLCPECGNCEKCAPNGCYVNHWNNTL